MIRLGILLVALCFILEMVGKRGMDQGKLN